MPSIGRKNLGVLRLDGALNHGPSSLLYDDTLRDTLGHFASIHLTIRTSHC